MAAKTQKEMVTELYQAVIGLPENPEENGLIGDVHEIKEILGVQNDRIRGSERSISRFKGVGIGLGTVGTIAIIVLAVVQLLG